MSAEPVRFEQWDALVELFGPANVKQTQGVYAKVANELRAAHYNQGQILRAGKAYQRDHKDWAFTPMALLKYIDQLLHIERRPPPTSSISQVDDRPGISLLEYVQTPEGKADPHVNPVMLDQLRRVWKQRQP